MLEVVTKNHMKYLIITATFLMCCFSSFAQGNNRVVKNFITKVADRTIQVRSILDSTLCSDKLPLPEEKAKLLAMQIEQLRQDLHKVRQWKIAKYDPQDPVDKTLLLGKINVNDVFKIQSPEKLMCYIWIKNNKVASFSTMNKGNKKMFIFLCD